MDLDISGVSDNDEENPGRYIGVNDDDDNNNSTPDKDETGTVSGEDDLVEISLSYEPSDLAPGYIELKIPNNIKVWSSSEKGTLVVPNGTDYYKRWSLGSQPSTLWVEGYSAGTANLYLLYSNSTNPAYPVYPSGDKNHDPVKFTIFEVEQNHDLWWFNGENPANYAIEVTLTAQGTTTGTFKWDVVTGTGKVNFENDSCTITKTNDNTVSVKSASQSTAMDDVTINFTYNGSYVCNHRLTVYAPDHLEHIDNNDIDWIDGYMSKIKYQTMDQFDHILPYDVEVDEVFTSSCIDDYPGGADWPQPGDSGTPLLNPTWEDGINAIGGQWYDPDPQHPQNPLGNTKVDHWSGDWYIGSKTDGSGVKVKSGCIWQRYLDHARHE